MSDSDRDHLDTLSKQEQTVALGSHDNVTGAMATLIQSESSGSAVEVGGRKEKTEVVSEAEPVARQPTMYVPLRRDPNIQVMRGTLPFSRLHYYTTESRLILKTWKGLQWNPYNVVTLGDLVQDFAESTVKHEPRSC